MATCVIENGLTLDCTRGVGGVNRIWLSNRKDFKTATIGLVPAPAPEEGAIGTIIPGSITPVFYAIEYTETTGLGNSNLQNAQTAAAPFFKHDVGLTIARFDQEVTNFMEKLVGSKVVALVESSLSNGNTTDPANRFFLFGFNNGLTVETMEAGLGQATTDLSGYTFLLSGGDPDGPKEVWPGLDNATIEGNLVTLTS